MLCHKIAAVQNGEMLLLEPSLEPSNHNRIIEEEIEGGQWQIESCGDDGVGVSSAYDLVSSGMTAGPDMDTFPPEQSSNIHTYGDDQGSDVISPQASQHSSLSPEDIQQQHQHQHQPSPSLQQQQHQAHFLPFTTWDFSPANGFVDSAPNTHAHSHTREADLYAQLRQDFASSGGAGAGGGAGGGPFGMPIPISGVDVGGDNPNVGMGSGAYVQW